MNAELGAPRQSRPDGSNGAKALREQVSGINQVWSALNVGGQVTFDFIAHMTPIRMVAHADLPHLANEQPEILRSCPAYQEIRSRGR